jgi:hypothetical protein
MSMFVPISLEVQSASPKSMRAVADSIIGVVIMGPLQKMTHLDTLFSFREVLRACQRVVGAVSANLRL